MHAKQEGQYIYGELMSPRGGYEKWVYVIAKQWNCDSYQKE